jgi:hypothetical protein
MKLSYCILVLYSTIFAWNWCHDDCLSTERQSPLGCYGIREVTSTNLYESDRNIAKNPLESRHVKQRNIKIYSRNIIGTCIENKILENV